jgi:hypothetical protein
MWQLPFCRFHTTNQVVESSLHFVGMHSRSKLKAHTIMDRLQTSGELQDKISFINLSTGVDLLKGYSLDYLLL